MIYIGQQQVEFNAITEVEKQSEPQSRNDVTFIDYDGTILTSYTSAEALALTSMPTLPFHSGLSAQGWNYTLEQMKSNVSSTGKCDIGCMYTTDDGKTRITLTIQDPKYSNIRLYFRQSIANGVEVYWGDESAIQTYTDLDVIITHQYSPQSYPATYTVTFNVINGNMEFPGAIMVVGGNQSASNPISIWTNMIDAVNIGNNFTRIGSGAFKYCYSLASITISNSVTNISDYAFCYCYSLTSVTIPNSITYINNYAFQYLYSLTSITIPNSVTYIGNYAFQYLYSLTSIAIPNSVTYIGNYAFSYLYSLTSIAIPNSITNIGNYVFSSCYSLASVTIQNFITNIGNYTFQYLCSLASITIPNSVTSIGVQIFYGCCGLKTFDFRTFTSVPSLNNVNAFQNTPSDKEIIVPDELYETWKAASNWSSTTNNIVNCITKASESSLGPLS